VHLVAQSGAALDQLRIIRVEADTELEYFLTAPIERIAIRRGDPLGFRAVADGFADILAPGLTNRTYDARWITLLCWIMVRVDEARRSLDLDWGEVGRARQRSIYDWIRPLELMWVRRTIRTFAGNPRLLGRRQLPGRLASSKMHENENLLGMTSAQFSRYRFTGPHGALSQSPSKITAHDRRQ